MIRKTIFFLFLIPKLLLSQIDSTDYKIQLDSLKFEFYQKLDSINESNILRLNGLEKSIKRNSQILIRINDSIIKNMNHINELNQSKEKVINDINIINSDVGDIKTKLNITSKKIDSEVLSINEILDSNSTIDILIFISIFIIVIISFLVLRKKFKTDSSIVEEKIIDTRKKLENQNIELDKKLIELYNTRLEKEKETRKDDNKVDHSLSLKVADEIIRMENNLQYMSSEIKGVKQLVRALKSIKDTFQINGYEIVEMIGKPYNEGINAIVNFVPDENLKEGQKIITRIIKPQVNFNGVMIQSSQIEVSVSE